MKQIRDLKKENARLIELVKQGADQIQIKACLADIALIASGESYE
jgi:hypothetical protein